MVGSALNLEYKSVVVCVPPGGSISSSVRPTVMLVCLKGTRWKNLSRNVHGEVVLRQYSEHKAEQQEQEQYKEPHEEPMMTSPL